MQAIKYDESWTRTNVSRHVRADSRVFYHCRDRMRSGDPSLAMRWAAALDGSTRIMRRHNEDVEIDIKVWQRRVNLRNRLEAMLEGWDARGSADIAALYVINDKRWGGK